MAAPESSSAAPNPNPNPSADSYIGSLISLTSKSEIRYEGILYNINTLESSIGLRNVRSFGTEGRKKEGPQIPASEKIYEYILFRGSDIKDLQVKSSPPAPTQPTAIHNDPAIIQSHYPQSASTTTSLPSVGTGPIADLSSNTAQLGLPRSTFQGSLPVYQPGAGLAPPPWGSSATPAANGSNLALPPMYWQYYAPSGGLPHLQQPPLLRPPGLTMPQPMQQPMQYPGMNSTVPYAPQSLPDYASPLFPPASTSALSSSSLTSGLAPASSGLLTQEASSALFPNNSSLATPPASTVSVSMSLMPPVSSNVDPIVTMPQNTSSVLGSKPNTGAGPTVQYRSTPPSVPPPVAVLSSSSQAETLPPLVTPDQLLPVSSSTLPPSQPSHSSHKDTDVITLEPKTKPLLPAPSSNITAEANEPILPLPKPSIQKPNGTSSYTQYNNRGRGRGRGTGYSRPVAKFTEDFDFTAMNEKFNKDEVWGHLGKSKAHLKDDELNEDEYDDILEVEEEEASKSVYNKDDFFDSLSCGTVGRGTNNGRTKFSEQLKLDAETFGDSARHRTNRGGRGYGYGGGRGRGSFYGRGYGYAGRGRGQFMSNRPF